MQADGSGRRKLTDAVREYVPTWSPDGRQIAYCARVGESNEVFIVNLDGSGRRQLTDHPAHDCFPSFSPDGTRLVFASKRGGTYDLYVMHADGSGVRRLIGE